MADHTDIIEVDQSTATYEIVVEIDEPKVKQMVSFELANAPSDFADPEFTNFDPAPGTTISRTRVISFDVIDDTALRVVVVMARFPNGDYEVVWDGSAFSKRYASSSRAAIAGGHRFSLSRTGGWPATPTFRGVAVDTSGNED